MTAFFFATLRVVRASSDANGDTWWARRCPRAPARTRKFAMQRATVAFCSTALCIQFFDFTAAGGTAGPCEPVGVSEHTLLQQCCASANTFGSSHPNRSGFFNRRPDCCPPVAARWKSCGLFLTHGLLQCNPAGACSAQILTAQPDVGLDLCCTTATFQSMMAAFLLPGSAVAAVSQSASLPRGVGEGPVPR